MTTKELYDHLKEHCDDIRTEMNFMLHCAEKGNISRVNESIGSIQWMVSNLPGWVEEYEEDKEN